ncbi:MAG: hypothetical protein M3Y69_05015, partial [Verrucomicrobiota bacterium]|nr:hypothetical protein [Verrucomicrobiota bacterium]
ANTIPGGGYYTPGSGGAVMADFVDLTMTDSMVQNCAASDYGGGVHIIEGSKSAISRTTFAQCRSAGSFGGALTMFGGELNASDSNFLQNSVPVGGRGAALTTVGDTSTPPRPAVDMTGVVQNCVFSDNPGGETIYDGDSTTDLPPYNRLQYSGNSFFTNDGPYTSDLGGSRTVAELNLLTFPRIVGLLTVKAPQPNIELKRPASVGTLMMVPASVSQTGAAGEATPIPSYLPFAWSGNNASLDGARLTASFGSSATTVEGAHKLVVDGTVYSTVPAVLLNISTRLRVLTDDKALIGGFIITGTEPKKVIIRAIGPSLTGIPGALQDPTLELFADATSLATNDNWAQDQAAEIRASGVAPTKDAEAAIVRTLNPGNYTAVVRGKNNSSGIGVVEVYDLAQGADAKLANISSRGFVDAGDNALIGGFISGGSATKVVIRAIGPSLADAGIAGPLANPTVQLVNASGTTIRFNDDWKSDQQRELEAIGIQPKRDAEAALIETLPAGNYTAIVRGKGDTTGIGLVEVYNVP